MSTVISVENVSQAYRLGQVGAGNVDMLQLGVSFGIMVVVLTVGLMLFPHVERTFMDTV
jgi:lipopolysaccharide transport system permease protein